jgi:hypothetical protein
MKWKRGNEERATRVVGRQYKDWLTDPDCPIIPPILEIPSDPNKYKAYWINQKLKERQAEIDSALVNNSLIVPGK